MEKGGETLDTATATATATASATATATAPTQHSAATAAVATAAPRNWIATTTAKVMPVFVTLS